MKVIKKYKINKLILLKSKVDIKFFCIVLILSSLVAFLFYHSFIPLISLIIFFPKLCQYYELSKKRKIEKTLLLEFKDLLYYLESSFEAGRSMSTALLEAEENLKNIYPKTARILVLLEDVNRKISKELLREELVLTKFAKNTNLSDVQNFFEAYFIAKESGGNIKKLIGRATKILIEKIEIESEIETVIAKKKFEGKILTVIPFVLMIFLNCSSSEYMEVLYEDLIGRVIMTIALGLIGLSYLLSEKITDIKV